VHALFVSLYMPANMTSTKPEIRNTLHIETPPEEDWATAIHNVHKKLSEERTCTCGDKVTDKHTHSGAE